MVRHTRDSAASPRRGQAENSKSAPEKGAAKAADKVADRGERVAKALARAGVASRREVERLINLGKVAVNGRVLDTPAVLVMKDDILTVDGKVVNGPEPTRLWRYHKPVGLVTTHKDPQGRPTVFEHLPEGLPRVISVGRLDLNSEGLLLLTNDGGLARTLEFPSTGLRRVYRARAYGRTTQAELDRLQDGVTLEGVRYGPIDARLDKAEAKADGRANLWITVTLAEGKNREVRRVLEGLGLKVNRLIRLAYGPFQLGALEDGAVEEVGPRVIRELLGELIAPENLPTGDRTPQPASRPGRRPTGSAPRGTGDPIADPNRKPSRTRAQLTAAKAELESQPERARPERARDDERPRGPGARGPRPDRKFEGRGEFKGPRRRFESEGGAGDSDRPRRAFDGDRPRPPRKFDDRGGYKGPRDRPAGEGGERGAGEFRPRPKRACEPRRDEGDGAPRARGPRPDKPYAKDGFRPRRDEGGEGGSDRPNRPPRGDRPGGYKGSRDRAGGEAGERGGGEFRPRPQRSYEPRRDEGDGPPRGRGPRPDKPYAKGPFRPRREDGAEGGSDRPARPPRGDRSGGYKGPRDRSSGDGGGERGEGGSGRPARPPRAPRGDFGGESRGESRGGYKGPRDRAGGGGKPFGGPKGGPRGGRPSGPGGPRPKGPRPPRREG